MSGHTPGPWQAFNGYLVRKCDGDSCASIAIVHTPYRKGVDIVKGQGETEANLRLIAAAPEQHDLLVEALDLVPRISDDDPMAPALAEWCRNVRAVIAKAKGKA